MDLFDILGAAEAEEGPSIAEEDEEDDDEEDDDDAAIESDTL